MGISAVGPAGYQWLPMNLVNRGFNVHGLYFLSYGHHAFL
jgi:hypothetical protein